MRNHTEPPLPKDSLFSIAPCDPSVLQQDVKKLTGQNRTVFEMLRRGPVTINDVLPLRITRLSARIQDIEAAGFLIDSVRVGSVAQYSLKGQA